MSNTIKIKRIESTIEKFYNDNNDYCEEMWVQYCIEHQCDTQNENHFWEFLGELSFEHEGN